ncbi:vascular-related unknown protein 4-like [Silene latifolia]|uniref:vascular-related unknown protein 4-like n=1 Tax=Silene latifolia TaxID=37657 RepID=UPI003D77BA98
MENSLSSTNFMIKSCSSRNNISCRSEESGWTLYLNDFMAGGFEVEDEMSSVVSDSLIVKRTNKGSHVDHDLEDTASSPSHSPMVDDENHLHKNLNGLHNRETSQEKGNNSQKQAEQGIDMNCIETQLRSKGLCVVPMSMLLGYLNY